MRKKTLVLPFVTCLFALGCAERAAVCDVSGKVSFRGEALAMGQIVFAHAEGRIPPVVGQIESGNYRVEVPPGEWRVRITSLVKTGKSFKGAMGVTVPEVRDLIPARYNTQSELARTVPADPAATIDFSLN